ncbi:MAG: glycosyltransferase [Puniceicoccaceae bacterium]
MEEPEQQLVLVTPVWNDSARLAVFGPELAAMLAGQTIPVRWMVVDDGSSEDEVAALEKLVEAFRDVYPAVGLMHHAVRSRKGGAIRNAWDTFPEAAWLAFVDADGAISADDLNRMFEETLASEGEVAVVAIRRDSPERPVTRPAFRSLSFHVFTRLTRLLLRVPFADSQCGAKVISAAAYHKVRPQLEETGFAFDAELLLALREIGCPIVEMPVTWTEKANGRVHPLRDAWRMLAALLKIRRRSRAGHYKA